MLGHTLIKRCLKSRGDDLHRFRRSTVLLVGLFVIGMGIYISFGGLSVIWKVVQEQYLRLLNVEFPYVEMSREYEDNDVEHMIEEQENYALAMENSVAQTTEESTKEQTTEEEKYSVDKLKSYTKKQLNDYDFLVKNLYYISNSTTITRKQLDGKKLLHKDLTIDKSGDKPQILIYHTHATEYFKDSDRNNPNELITGVGDYLVKILEEKYGYSVVHDKTVFAYNQAYSLGREKVKEILKKYPSIKVIIDLHRDSSGGHHYVTKINGKKMASIMFFNGMSQDAKGRQIDSRDNPNLTTNLAFSLQMKVAADEMYPGLTRKNYLKAYRYNMHLMGRYALVEVGAENNTLKEAKNSMEPLAKILDTVLQ